MLSILHRKVGVSRQPQGMQVRGAVLYRECHHRVYALVRQKRGGVSVHLN